MPDVVRAFVRRKKVDRRGDQIADVIEAARTRRAGERFQFGEGELEWIEIRTVGREESEVRARLFDGRSDRGLLVDDEVVEYDDIAGAEGRHEHLFDVGQETRAIDRPIEDRGAPDPRGGGRRSPCASASDYRACDPESRATGAPAVAP